MPVNYKQNRFLPFEAIKPDSKWIFNDGSLGYVKVIDTHNNQIYYRCIGANGKIYLNIYNKDTFSFQVRYRPMVEQTA